MTMIMAFFTYLSVILVFVVVSDALNMPPSTSSHRRAFLSSIIAQTMTQTLTTSSILLSYPLVTQAQDATKDATIGVKWISGKNPVPNKDGERQHHVITTSCNDNIM